MQRYHDLIESEKIESLKEVGKICMKLSKRPPETFHEAVQSLWFLFVILHMESMLLLFFHQGEWINIFILIIKEI